MYNMNDKHKSKKILFSLSPNFHSIGYSTTLGFTIIQIKIIGEAHF